MDSIRRNSAASEKAYLSGLHKCQQFLLQDDKLNNYSIETIVPPLLKQEINLYELLDRFVSFLSSLNLLAPSIKLYMGGLRSYLAYHDIDMVPSKFKRKVKMPKIYREDEEALDIQDIRDLLLVCNNRRLKAYILVLASGGFRAVEALAIRFKDIDFSSSPTQIHVRKEYSKTRISRDVYISDEATKFLKDWIDWKYKDKDYDWTKELKSDDLVFSAYRVKGRADPKIIYFKIIDEFEKLLSVAGMDERKEDGLGRRRKITLHSLRRFVKTVISDQVGQDYSEWFLGHAKSPYYTKKEIDRREIYATKCMKYLTFLDYTTLEARGKGIEAKLREKDRELHDMKEKYESEIESIREETNQKFNQIMAMIQQNPQLAQIKPEALASCCQANRTIKEVRNP
ncbi:MAG: site-specific integrase [Nitrososphaeraceae archaeon]